MDNTYWNGQDTAPEGSLYCNTLADLNNIGFNPTIAKKVRSELRKDKNEIYECSENTGLYTCYHICFTGKLLFKLGTDITQKILAGRLDSVKNFELRR